MRDPQHAAPSAGVDLYEWTDPDVEPYCPDHSFTGTHFRWDEDAEVWLCRRCMSESRLLDEAGL